MKKTRAKKLKIQEKHTTSTSLLMFSPEFNLELESSATLPFYLSHLNQNITLIICRKVKEEIK